MGMDVSSQAAAGAHREPVLRAVTPELLLDQEGGRPVGGRERLARTAEAEGKSGEESALRDQGGEEREDSESSSSSDDGRGRVLDVNA